MLPCFARMAVLASFQYEAESFISFSEFWEGQGTFTMAPVSFFAASNVKRRFTKWSAPAS